MPLVALLFLAVAARRTIIGKVVGMSDVQPVWPAAQLDQIARLRLQVEASPRLVGVEQVIDAPFDAVWRWIEDLESSVPEFDRSVRRLRVVERDGADLELTASGFGAPVGMRFTARLEPGLCVMRARVYFVGMAAVADGDRTRFLHVEGVPLPGVGRVARPFVRREVRSDLANIARHFR